MAPIRNHMPMCIAILLINLCQRVLADKRNDTFIPAPIAVAPSQLWEGIDGTWSTFVAQVGTPAQNVHLLVSTAATMTTVVLPDGCHYSSSSSTCPDDRGQLFNPNASTSWFNYDVFTLSLEDNLGMSANGQFGKDTVALDWQGSGGPKLEGQIVAGVATQQFYLGEFGITPRPINLTNFNDPHPSFVETLKTNNMIPSTCWSYTAGAKYRLNGVFGSLIFGGYDQSLFEPSNVSFPFSSDISRDLTVAVQSISLQDSVRSDFELLPSPIYAFIDSTVPYLYLPKEACMSFENTFGIDWDEQSELYFVDAQQHELLLARNPEVTFTLSTRLSAGPTTKIVLPYAALDLVAKYPLVANGTRNYFPLKRAANDTQYTLGRAFLQEAYLTVDYERSNFSVSQRIFKDGATQDLVPIMSKDYVPPPSPHKTPIGPIVGGVVGGFFGLSAIVGIFILYRLKRRSRRNTSESGTRISASTAVPGSTYSGKAELDASGYFLPPKSELDYNSEIQSPSRSELSYIGMHNDAKHGGNPVEVSSHPVHEAPSHPQTPSEVYSRPVLEAPSNDAFHRQTRMVHELAGSDVAEAPYHAEARPGNRTPRSGYDSPRHSEKG